MNLHETITPKNYKSCLNPRQTQRAIKIIKDSFQTNLADLLNLERVSAPLFVRSNSGLNDDLNGVERPVSFSVKDIYDDKLEIVHSLAKWKRMALHRYGFKVGEGLYTDMNAIRRDEDLDNLHSLYVDQWDWEKCISKEDRNINTLKETVKLIYKALKHTQQTVINAFPSLAPAFLPKDISFITTQQLEDKYPSLSPKERENAIAKEKGAVFIMQIGGLLKSGKKHDGRAPDYDDWSLNGDIIIWNDLLGCGIEISSMGVRVDEVSLIKQLKEANCEERCNLPFHKALLNSELPYTIGGGIGQSRLCMLLLRKAHIGEIQASVWPDDMIEKCNQNNIFLL